MTAVVVTPIPVSAPAVEQVAALVLVTGGVMAHIIRGTQHLAAFRVLRVTQHQLDYDEGSDLLVDQSPQGLSSTNWSYFRTTSRARRLWVGFWAQGTYASGGDAPTIEARIIRVSDGTEIDPGVIWSRGLVGHADDTFPLMFLHTGWASVDAPGAQTGPRLFDLDEEQDELLAVEWTCTDARLVRVTLAEVFEATTTAAFAP